MVRYGGNAVIASGVSSALYFLGVISLSCAVDAHAGWSLVGGPQMSKARYRHTATLLRDGRLLVAGGATAGTSDQITAAAEILDPDVGRWTDAGTMITARYQHTAVLLPDGRVFVAGGRDRSSTEIFDPNALSWSPGPMMSQPRANHTSTLLRDGRVLICGGEEAGSSTTSTEIFDPANGKIVRAPSMGVPRSSHAAALLSDGRV